MAAEKFGDGSVPPKPPTVEPDDWIKAHQAKEAAAARKMGWRPPRNAWERAALHADTETIPLTLKRLGVDLTNEPDL